MQITVLAGGVGGARFTRGLSAQLEITPGRHRITVIANTGDDITMHGLRVCPDVDTLINTLGGSIDEERGWGRAKETDVVQSEIFAYGGTPQWFTLGDKDLAAHIVRSQWLGQGLTASEVTARLANRWGLPERGISILPMTDDPVETHVVVSDGEGGSRAIHFQEWWVRHRAALPAERFVVAGLDRARPAPGVLEAIASADAVLLPPSNPVVSIGIILGVEGVREALRDTPAPIAGVSPLIAGSPVRGYADACLSAIGVEATAKGVGGLYRDFLDSWLVDPSDADTNIEGVRVHAYDQPLLMPDPEAAARLAGATLDLALGSA